LTKKTNEELMKDILFYKKTLKEKNEYIEEQQDKIENLQNEGNNQRNFIQEQKDTIHKRELEGMENDKIIDNLKTEILGNESTIALLKEFILNMENDHKILCTRIDDLLMQ
jgi:chromosome segregation ATPase